MTVLIFFYNYPIGAITNFLIFRINQLNFEINFSHPSNINKKSGCSTSQMAEEYTGHLMERQNTVEARAGTGQQTMDNILREDDFAGLDMSSVWTTSAYHSKHCTGRYQNAREDMQVDQERTGVAWPAKTYERWGSPGRKQRWQLLTDTDGVGVWPNVSSWIGAESRSRSRPPKGTSLCRTTSYDVLSAKIGPTAFTVGARKY